MEYQNKVFHNNQLSVIGSLAGNSQCFTSPWASTCYSSHAQKIEVFISLEFGWKQMKFSPHSNGYDDIMKCKYFPRYWPFVRGIHRSPVNSPQKGQWRGALMFSLICSWTNGWINNREAGDLRRHQSHYDGTVMVMIKLLVTCHHVKPMRHFNWSSVV